MTTLFTSSVNSLAFMLIFCILTFVSASDLVDTGQKTIQSDLIYANKTMPKSYKGGLELNSWRNEPNQLTFSPRTLLFSTGQINKNFAFTDFLTYGVFSRLLRYAFKSIAVVAVSQLVGYPLFAFASYAAVAAITVVSVPVVIASAYGLIYLAKYLFPKLKTFKPKYEGPYWKAEIRLRKKGDEDEEEEHKPQQGWPSPPMNFKPPQQSHGTGWLPYDTVAFGIPAMDKASIRAAKKASKYHKKAKKYAEKASKYAAKAQAAKQAIRPLYAHDLTHPLHGAHHGHGGPPGHGHGGQHGHGHVGHQGYGLHHDHDEDEDD